MNIPILTGQPAAPAIPPAAEVADPSPTLKPLPARQGVLLAIALLLLTAAMVVAGLVTMKGTPLVLITLGMVLFFVLVSAAITGNGLGVLINSKNLMSLSRFQMAIWTIVILSSYMAFVLARLRLDSSVALDIEIPSELLAQLGISATTLLASPLILASKAKNAPAPESVARTAVQTGETTDEVDTNRRGVLYANTAMKDARFTDLFQGDEVGNTTYVDMAKLQMFFFTVIGACVYFAMTFRLLMVNFDGDAAIANLGKLPEPSEGLTLALLISHGGYLGSKGLKHTPTTQ